MPGVARVEPVAQVRPQRVVRVADLALAGQEHQDVARSLGGQLVDRLADPGHQVTRVVAPGRRGAPPGRRGTPAAPPPAMITGSRRNPARFLPICAEKWRS